MYKFFLICITTLLCFASASYGANYDIASYFIDAKKLYIPAVRINGIYFNNEGETTIERTTETKSYRLDLKLDEDTLQFSINSLTPISNYEYYLYNLKIGTTYDDVIMTLGEPTEKYDRIFSYTTMGATPNNLSEGTPYEEWQYRVDGMIYMLWFAATIPDVPKEEWLLQGVTSFPAEGVHW